MNTTIQKTDGALTALLDGELDTAAAVEAERAMQPLFECKDCEIVLDCTDLRYISSSGLRLFLNVLKSGKANGCKVSLRHLNDDIMKVFQMTGFNNLFEIK